MIEWIITSSVLITVIAMLRFILRGKISLKLQYALWGLVLCRYGIEFVEDPKTHTRIPTCHRASRTSILLDPDFKSALKYADKEKREVYSDNAHRIDQIQKAILSMSDTQEKYEVFICYKETDDNGERTVDSVLAQELYNELAKMRIKTFFARKTLF